MNVTLAQTDKSEFKAVLGRIFAHMFFGVTCAASSSSTSNKKQG
jgi:hypothetical protein